MDNFQRKHGMLTIPKIRSCFSSWCIGLLDVVDLTFVINGSVIFFLPFFFLSQRLVTCLASEAKCSGELIEKFRYWMLQMAMMDNILGVCTDIQYSNLKTLVDESGLYWTGHRNVKSFTHPLTRSHINSFISSFFPPFLSSFVPLFILSFPPSYLSSEWSTEF